MRDFPPNHLPSHDFISRVQVAEIVSCCCAGAIEQLTPFEATAIYLELLTVRTQSQCSIRGHTHT